MESLYYACAFSLLISHILNERIRFPLSQIVGEVLKQLTEDKFIVKATNGPRYVVGCRRQLDKEKLKVFNVPLLN